MNNICFAFKDTGKCAVLKDLSKCHIGCTFFKTQAELNEGRRMSLMRLSKLSMHTQSEIAEKYYGGRMPMMRGDDLK